MEKTNKKVEIMFPQFLMHTNMKTM